MAERCLTWSPHGRTYYCFGTQQPTHTPAGDRHPYEYSTTWLAWAAREASSDGHVARIERDSGKSEMVDENLHRADLRDIVDLLIGDAAEVVASLPGPFDFVFFDADRVSGPVQLALLVSKLARTPCSSPR